jgi:hypothetical protein
MGNAHGRDFNRAVHRVEGGQRVQKKNYKLKHDRHWGGKTKNRKIFFFLEIKNNESSVFGSLGVGCTQQTINAELID